MHGVPERVLLRHLLTESGGSRLEAARAASISRSLVKGQSSSAHKEARTPLSACGPHVPSLGIATPCWVLAALAIPTHVTLHTPLRILQLRPTVWAGAR